MKKTLAILLTAVSLLFVLSGCGEKSGEMVTVQKVSRIVAQGSVGLVNRYAGMVVSGDTANLKKDDKKIQEVYVREGDWVSEGDVLFSYDMDALELDLSKLLLELDGLDNTIQTAQEEIPELEKQRDAAPAAQQLSYSLQIQSLQADIREATYNKGLKEREIQELQEALEDTDVRSPISGRVMSVKDTDGASSGGWGESGSDAFITVMDMTTYRIKGTINEMNVGTLSEGMNVIVRSRLDESVIWTGVLTEIDWENQVSQNNNNYYMGPTDEMTTSSKYPFYVELTNVTGLILGQHVYIEPDYGQTETREGIWLPEYFISDSGSDPWVWAAGRRSRLEKRTVVLGDYDGERGEYQILSGLGTDDYIAFPEEGLRPGMTTVTYEEAASLSYVSGGNAFYGGGFASGGDAWEEDLWEPPEEEMFADEEEIPLPEGEQEERGEEIVAEEVSDDAS